MYCSKSFFSFRDFLKLLHRSMHSPGLDEVSLWVHHFWIPWIFSSLAFPAIYPRALFMENPRSTLDLRLTQCSLIFHFILWPIFSRSVNTALAIITVWDQNSSKVWDSLVRFLSCFCLVFLCSPRLHLFVQEYSKNSNTVKCITI